MQGFAGGYAASADTQIRRSARSRSRRAAVGAAGRIGNDQSQIDHGEVASAKIADERKPVSVLEAANRDHITAESTRYIVERGGYQRDIGSPRIDVRSRCG